MSLVDEIEGAMNQVAASQKLIRASRLLQKVWGEVGPYREGEIEEDTWREVNELMGLDDSE